MYSAILPSKELGVFTVPLDAKLTLLLDDLEEIPYAFEFTHSSGSYYNIAIPEIENLL